MGEPTSTTRPPGSASGVRVESEPRYLPDHSDPNEPRFVFAYKIRITNGGDAPVQLLWRRWEIVDSLGRKREISGRGVIGEQPTLTSGDSFEYESFCPLATTCGTMEGAFTFQRERGGMFEAPVGPIVFSTETDSDLAMDQF